MLRTTLLASAGALALGTAAFAQDMDIIDTAQNAGNFTTLLAAVEAAGLTETLRGEGPFTVFAPTDEAFAALPEGTVDSLLADPEALANILTYHVVPGRVMSSDLTEGMTAETVQGSEVTFTLEGGPMINDAMISQPDIEASNGVIHVIDSVIMPPEG
ncbi:fasciclin domain-containing protein [Rubellimicrobium sp. CFH 75288]|uniref:fasciclin domain-containing protein n=1 Tax=Rubellimicrobium sp. CFH 75288 TaxID=2697034 RepID=UPI00141219E8|nr:fasciclin domain-containing protein [Rubellimicrobium sp. CFH 75288]NAZ36320.1 fasciclin domain-containing protein [Rubellimicrobium sp. CFH 75288]